jgi:tetratricopeptide (TPR) repeat protein
MEKKRPVSPLVSKYLAIYRKNPDSRVFAPLAEAYRKYGMLTEAINLLNEGIRKHPGYLLGYITLGNCYFDLKKYDLAYSSLRPFIANNRDNISLQKLYAKTCEFLDRDSEALETYKYLLFLNPKDYHLAKKVQQLEDIGHESPVIKNHSSESFELTKLDQQIDVFSDVDDWVRMDLSSTTENKNDESSLDEFRTSELDSWREVRKLDTDSDDDEEADKNLDDENDRPTSLDMEGDEAGGDSSSRESIEANRFEVDELEEQQSPILTHTLVDLYYQQGHLHKAVEVLEKIQSLNPDDQMTRDRLESLRLELNGEPESVGREKLMETFDTRLSSSILESLEGEKEQESDETLVEQLNATVEVNLTTDGNQHKRLEKLELLREKYELYIRRLKEKKNERSEQL